MKREVHKDKIIIRNFEVFDGPAVSELIRETMMISNSTDYPSSILEPLRDYFTPEKVVILEQERYCIVAADEGGKIVGTGSLEDGELKTLFVLPTYQSMGVGKLIVKGLEDEAISTGLESIRVPASITGVGFYRKMGYVEGESFMSENAGKQTWMTKELNSSLGQEDR